MIFFLSPHHRVGGRHQQSGMALRRCGFECLEPRQMLAADLAGGAADLSFGDTAFGHTDGPTGSIGGSVYTASSAANCDSHAASASLAEVRVQLLNEAGTVIEESSTDTTGAYLFADLLPGQYAVRQIAQNALLEGDLLQRAAHVGDGGGIALDSNLVGEIVVQAGETLGGYDFCEFTSSVGPAGPTDRPIVPHADVVQALPILALSLQSSSVAKAEIFEEPTVETTKNVVLLVPSLLNLSRPLEVYGGSGRVLKKSESTKAWDESPLDGYFSTASFLELATAELPTSDAFDPILGESLLSDSDGAFADENVADRYLAYSIEWWEDEAQLELEPSPELLTEDEEIIDLAVEAVDLAVPMIARLLDAN